MLEDDDVVIQQQLLLPRHIDKHIRIALIQIMNGHAFHLAQCLQQSLVGMGAVIAGMGKQDQYLFHAGHRAPVKQR